MSKHRYEQYTEIPYEQAPVDRNYLHTTQAGAVLPLIQASITGIILFFAVAVIGALAKIPKPTTTGLIVGILAWLITWLILQRHWFTLTNIEKFTGLDLDNNKIVGEPKQIHVTVTDEKTQTQTIARLPATERQMQQLARGLLAGDSFSVRNWTGSGKPFSINEFSALREELITRGLLAEANSKDPRQGFVLNAAGRAVMRWFNSPIEDESQ